MPKYALIIANSVYTDSGLAKLSAPGKDAQDFARVLQAEDIGAFDYVTIVENESEAVVRDAIDLLFSSKKHDDLLVMYFSGHGVRDEYGALYLAVKNTNRTRLRASAIKSDFVRESMDQSNSRRQVLILDCCNSGAFAQGTKAATGVSIGTGPAFEGVGYGRVVLTATDATQFAWEGDKIIGEETTNSLFTHFLVQGLQGEADRDGDGRISVDELYDYAYEQIVSRTPKQTPGKWSYKQQGEILLRQPAHEEPRPLPLPADLTAAITSSYPSIRETAVRQLEELLKGRSVGHALSARAILERIVSEDDSRRVAQVASQVLAPLRQAEAERLATIAEAERLAVVAAAERVAEEERIDLAKTTVEHEVGAEREVEEKGIPTAEREVQEEHFEQTKAEGESVATIMAEKGRIAGKLAAHATTQSLNKTRVAAAAVAAAEARRQEEKFLAQAKKEAERNTDAVAPNVIEEPIAHANTEQPVDESTGTVPTEIAQVTGEKASHEFEKETNTIRPAWSAVLWMAMGEAVVFSLIMPLISAINNSFSGNSGYVITAIIIGALGGLVIAIVLQRAHVISDWKSLLWISLGWTISLVLSVLVLNASGDGILTFIVVAVILGGMAGLVVALRLRQENALSGWKSMLWISLGWIMALLLAIAVGGITTSVFYAIGIEGGSDISNLLVFGLMGFAAGASGGAVIVFQLRRARLGMRLPLAPKKEKDTARPGWSTVFWIALSLSFVSLITFPLQVGLNDASIDWDLSFIIAFALSGSLAGFMIALILRLTHVLTGWKSMLWLSLLWAIILSPVNNMMSQDDPTFRLLVTGIWSGVGGFAIALTLWQYQVLRSRKSILWVSLGWTVGIALCILLAKVGRFDDSSNMLLDISVGALLGVIGGGVMVFQLRKESS